MAGWELSGEWSALDDISLELRSYLNIPNLRPLLRAKHVLTGDELEQLEISASNPRARAIDRLVSILKTKCPNHAEVFLEVLQLSLEQADYHRGHEYLAERLEAAISERKAVARERKISELSFDEEALRQQIRDLEIPGHPPARPSDSGLGMAGSGASSQDTTGSPRSTFSGSGASAVSLGDGYPHPRQRRLHVRGLDNLRRERGPTHGLNEKQVSVLKHKIVSDTNNIITRFALMVVGVYRLLKQKKTPVDEVRIMLQYLGCLTNTAPNGDNSVALFSPSDEISESKDLGRLIECLKKYSSWYNYRLIKEVAENFAGEEGKKLISDYEAELQKHYASLIAYQCPDFGLERKLPPGYTRLIVKVNWEYMSTNLQDIAVFQSNLVEILELEPYVVQLRSVEEGCVRLEYVLPATLEPHVARIMTEREECLRELEVLSLEIMCAPLPTSFSVGAYQHSPRSVGSGWLSSGGGLCSHAPCTPTLSGSSSIISVLDQPMSSQEAEILSVYDSSRSSSRETSMHEEVEDSFTSAGFVATRDDAAERNASRRRVGSEYEDVDGYCSRGDGCRGDGNYGDGSQRNGGRCNDGQGDRSHGDGYRGGASRSERCLNESGISDSGRGDSWQSEADLAPSDRGPYSAPQFGSCELLSSSPSAKKLTPSETTPVRMKRVCCSEGNLLSALPPQSSLSRGAGKEGISLPDILCEDGATTTPGEGGSMATPKTRKRKRIMRSLRKIPWSILSRLFLSERKSSREERERTMLCTSPTLLSPFPFPLLELAEEPRRVGSSRQDIAQFDYKLPVLKIEDLHCDLSQRETETVVEEEEIIATLPFVHGESRRDSAVPSSPSTSPLPLPSAAGLGQRRGSDLPPSPTLSSFQDALPPVVVARPRTEIRETGYSTYRDSGVGSSFNSVSSRSNAAQYQHQTSTESVDSFSLASLSTQLSSKRNSCTSHHYVNINTILEIPDDASDTIIQTEWPPRNSVSFPQYHPVPPPPLPDQKYPGDSFESRERSSSLTENFNRSVHGNTRIPSSVSSPHSSGYASCASSMANVAMQSEESLIGSTASVGGGKSPSLRSHPTSPPFPSAPVYPGNVRRGGSLKASVRLATYVSKPPLLPPRGDNPTL
jgi:hypothetical protein